MHAENTQTDPNQLIQQLSKSVKGRELLEMLEEALKQSDPADLETKISTPGGIRTPTLGSEDRCSIQLSYGCVSSRTEFY